MIIPFSADFESHYIGMSDEEKKKFAEEHPGVQSQLPKIIKTGYSALQLIYFFTVGKDEVRAWTIQVREILDPVLLVCMLFTYFTPNHMAASDAF